MRFWKETHFNFMKWKTKGFMFSLFLIVLGMGFFSWRGIKNFGIDFTGGTMLYFYFKKPVEIAQIREVLKEAGAEESLIQSFESGRGLIIRTKEGYRKKVEEAVLSRLKSFNPEVREEKTIGPVVGRLLRRQALLAITFSMIGILLYIAWRFELVFAVAAVLCLLHDVLITTGMLSLTGREISIPIIAALLTIVGYSLNDTIVVFDRIRENLKLYRGKRLEEIINISINQTLSRTTLTSLTTLMVVLSLFFLGSTPIKDFSFTMAVGIVVGTYSSIFIASPLVVIWKKEKKRGKR